MMLSFTGLNMNILKIIKYQETIFRMYKNTTGNGVKVSGNIQKI